MKVSVLAAVLVLSAVLELGFCQDYQKSSEIESLSRFAVKEHNRLENGLLEFARVVKVQEQVVAGKLYHLTLEAIDAGMKKMYEAKVWVKPWMNFKQLQEFKLESHVSPLSDFSIIHGLQEIPIQDPEVRTAANHAVKTIQQRSNSLFPYQLLEVIHAKVEIIEDFVKFDLLLKLKRGVKEEMFKVNVHKTYGDNYLLKLMEPYNP